MAAPIAVHPINRAQITTALATYASDQTIVAGLTALDDLLKDEPYKCTKCGGAKTVTTNDYGATIPEVFCDVCDGNGVTTALYSKTYTGKATYTAQ